MIATQVAGVPDAAAGRRPHHRPDAAAARAEPVHLQLARAPITGSARPAGRTPQPALIPDSQWSAVSAPASATAASARSPGTARTGRRSGRLCHRSRHMRRGPGRWNSLPCKRRRVEERHQAAAFCRFEQGRLTKRDKGDADAAPTTRTGGRGRCGRSRRSRSRPWTPCRGRPTSSAPRWRITTTTADADGRRDRRSSTQSSRPRLDRSGRRGARAPARRPLQVRARRRSRARSPMGAGGGEQRQVVRRAIPRATRRSSQA